MTLARIAIVSIDDTLSAEVILTLAHVAIVTVDTSAVEGVPYSLTNTSVLTLVNLTWHDNCQKQHNTTTLCHCP